MCVAGCMRVCACVRVCVCAWGTDFRLRMLFNGVDVTHRLECHNPRGVSDMCAFSHFRRAVPSLQEWKEQCKR